MLYILAPLSRQLRMRGDDLLGQDWYRTPHIARILGQNPPSQATGPRNNALIVQYLRLPGGPQVCLTIARIHGG